ncbi:MAG: hypothetical protein J5J00_05390 [Deltaproteobacteria bacterium]|nr:hypothetical protein [Deltaproteobacteria bacterium]
MSRKDAVVQRFELFVATAAVAAHASYAAEGFRQRDVKFLIELFSNWLEPTLQTFTIPIQNTQVQRYLNALVADGFARQVARKRPPVYRLTRVGLLELVTRIVDTSKVAHQQHFFFLCYFIKNYKPKIEQLIAEEGKQFPYALRLELDALMNVNELIKREIEHVKREIKKLDERIEDATKTSQLTVRMKREGASVREIVAQAEKLYPYEFNSQKPLSSLISEIPGDMRLWELETGNLKRVEQIWQPCRNMLMHYKSELEKIAQQEK